MKMWKNTWMKFKFQVADSTTPFLNCFQLYTECLTFYLTGTSPVCSSSWILVDVKHNLWVTWPTKTGTLHKMLQIRDWHVPRVPATQSTARGVGTRVFHYSALGVWPDTRRRKKRSSWQLVRAPLGKQNSYKNSSELSTHDKKSNQSRNPSVNEELHLNSTTHHSETKSSSYEGITGWRRRVPRPQLIFCLLFGQGVWAFNHFSISWCRL